MHLPNPDPPQLTWPGGRDSPKGLFFLLPCSSSVKLEITKETK